MKSLTLRRAQLVMITVSFAVPLTVISSVVPAQASEIGLSIAKRQILSETSTTSDISKRQRFYDPVLLQDDKWGWNLRDYKSIGPAYRLHQKICLLISEGTGANGNVRCCEYQDSYLWNPLSGEYRHLNRDERINFEQQHKSEVILSLPNSPRGMPLELGHRISQRYSPGFAPKCYINYSRYCVAMDEVGDEIRSFYLITRLGKPEAQTVRICVPDSTAFVQEHITEAEQTPALQIAPLDDGGALVWSDENGFVLRLDPDFRQHSTINGRVITIDANPVNGLLEASPGRLDPSGRAKIFAEAINRQKKGEDK